jgi:hypothetical protein
VGAPIGSSGGIFSVAVRIPAVTPHDTPLHLYAATSGWEGPFQHEQVVVAAADPDSARRIAEEAFAGVAQPVCRAKMRMADLGPLGAGVVAGPLRAGDSLARDGLPVDMRCGPEGA